MSQYFYQWLDTQFQKEYIFKRPDKFIALKNHNINHQIDINQQQP
jgi:hypothetical protein